MSQTALLQRPKLELGSAILDGLRAGVIATDSDDVVIHANYAAEQIFRRSRDSMIGRRIHELLPSFRESRTGREERCEMSIRRGDGTVASLGLTMGSYVDDQGERVGSVALFQDIGPIVALRKERDRLLQLAALGDALPSVLHELRNPLAAMTAMLELLIEESSGDLQHDLHGLLVQARRMTLGLEGIGGFVRPVAARRYAAIDHAVREAVRVLEPSASQRGITLTSTGPDLPLLPIAPGPVSGVVFNLVRNAIDASSEGGSIEVDAHIDGTSFVLAVSDSGVGMSEETAARACDLFFTSKDKGSGIGLALCRQVAESSGGSLSIESALGKGTRVTLRVPVGEPSPERQ